MTTDTDAYVIIPAFNEERMIGDVVAALGERWPRVLVVDDGSTDATGGMAQEKGAQVLRHAINRGQGAALQTGIAAALDAGAQYVVTFDADGQHDPASIDDLLQPLREGRAEIALGSRFLRDDVRVPIARRLLLKVAVQFTRWTSGLKVTDTHNGLRAFSRKAAQALNLKLDRMAHASELLDQVRQSGLAYVEVPVRVHYTRYSRAKGQSSTAAFRIAIDYLIGRILR